MRWTRMLSIGVAATLLAVPASAAVKALTLRELMEITTDCLDGQIVAKQTFRVDHPDYEGVSLIEGGGPLINSHHSHVSFSLM